MFELRSISKTHHLPDRTKVEALRDVTVSVGKGEIFGLIGPSGAGKSTALRCFNLLESPDYGRVIFDGAELSPKRPRELLQARQKIGMIFQQFHLLSNKTVAGNIALPLRISGWKTKDIERRIGETLELVRLSDKAKAYPHQLSGGQKQRVAIARSIANNPALLLADEPSSALDPITKIEILDCLADINRQLNLTIIITTHEMNIVRRLCHRVALFENGHIIERLKVENGDFRPQTKLGKLLAEIT